MLRRKALDGGIMILSGGASGADLMGEQYAADRGYTVQRYPAQWNIFGKRAGLIRNRLMAENADALIAFWDGRSKGTQNMIYEAMRAGLQIAVKQIRLDRRGQGVI